MANEVDQSAIAARKIAHEILRKRRIILECENGPQPCGEYHGEQVYDGRELIGAELLAIEQLESLLTPPLVEYASLAMAAEREECAKLVCHFCAYPGNLYSPAEVKNGRWRHRNTKEPLAIMVCSAGPIWSRASQPADTTVVRFLPPETHTDFVSRRLENPEPQGGKEVPTALPEPAERAALKSAGDGWILCSERLPEKRPTYSTSARVEIYFPNHREGYCFRVGRYDPANDLFDCDGGASFDAKDASHWRFPLPPAHVQPAEGPAAKEGK